MKKPQSNERQPQDTPSTPRRRKSPPPKPPTWNQQKAVALAKKGVSSSDIAAVVGRHQTTVSDYLRRVLPEFTALQSFRDHLGDSLALSLATLTDLEHKLLRLLNDEELLSSLSASEKERLLGRVAIAKGIVFDKWRLHEGKSTSNQSYILQVQQAHTTEMLFPASRGSIGDTTDGGTEQETQGIDMKEEIN